MSRPAKITALRLKLNATARRYAAANQRVCADPQSVTAYAMREGWDRSCYLTSIALQSEIDAHEARVSLRLIRARARYRLARNPTGAQWGFYVGWDRAYRKAQKMDRPYG